MEAKYNTFGICVTCFPDKIALRDCAKPNFRLVTAFFCIMTYLKAGLLVGWWGICFVLYILRAKELSPVFKWVLLTVHSISSQTVLCRCEQGENVTFARAWPLPKMHHTVLSLRVLNWFSFIVSSWKTLCYVYIRLVVGLPEKRAKLSWQDVEVGQ